MYKHNFPHFSMDVAHYADFGYSKISVASAMVGLLVAMYMDASTMGRLEYPFGVYFALGAVASFAVGYIVAVCMERQRISTGHVALVERMPWNESGRVALDCFKATTPTLRLRHLRLIAQAHLVQVALDGGNTYEVEGAVLGRSLDMRFPTA